LLDARFAKALGSLALDDEVVDWMTAALRQSHADEKRFHDEAIGRLQAEYQVLQQRLDSMYVDKLDGRIAAEFFERKSAEWRRRQSTILRSTEKHQEANQNYLEDGLRMLELAGRAHDMFLTLDADGKRRLVSLLISGSTWKEGELSVTFRPPFDIILHGVLQARTASGSGGVLTLPLRSRSSTRRESLRSNSPAEADLNSKIAAKGPSQAETEIWLRSRDSNPEPCG
jgi:site-specific DNA recombinase